MLLITIFTVVTICSYFNAKLIIVLLGGGGGT